MSHPLLSTWVAKLLRMVRHEMRFSMPNERNLQLSLPASAARLARRGDEDTHGRGDHRRFLTREDILPDLLPIAQSSWLRTYVGRTSSHM